MESPMTYRIGVICLKLAYEERTTQTKQQTQQAETIKVPRNDLPRWRMHPTNSTTGLHPPLIPTCRPKKQNGRHLYCGVYYPLQNNLSMKIFPGYPL